MSQPSFDDLFNAVLADTTAQALSDSERSALEVVFGSFAAALSASSAGSPEQPSVKAGLELADLFDGALSMSTPLSEQSDEELVASLHHHVESASTIVELLQQRPLAQQYLDPLRQLELQLVATSINVEVLQAGITPTPDSHRWWSRIKAVLLHEFDFINRWFR